MRIGFLHLGDRRHGVSRYGRLLAGELDRRPDVEVVEQEPAQEGRTVKDRKALIRAARALSCCDVVHVQYNRTLWGPGRSQLGALRRFTAHCRAPLVASLHDVYLDDPWERWRHRSRSPWRRLRRRYRAHRQRTVIQKAVRLLHRHCRRVLVCFEQERSRLRPFRLDQRVRVVGHFVEERPALPDRLESRRLLGLDSRRVATVLGFIHPRKGYDLVVDALELLPEDVLVVFAGTASEGNERALRRWEKKAEKRGQGHRLKVTGYLEDELQARWLVATDLGICPFRFFSASGSLATWCSVGKPVLCHDLPQIEEYRAISPDSFFTFEDYTPESFANAVTAALERVDGRPDPAMLILRDHFSIARTADRHLALYREVLEENRSSP